MSDYEREVLGNILQACETAGLPAVYLLDELLSNAFHATDDELRQMQDFVASWKPAPESDGSSSTV